MIGLPAAASIDDVGHLPAGDLPHPLDGILGLDVDDVVGADLQRAVEPELVARHAGDDDL